MRGAGSPQPRLGRALRAGRRRASRPRSPNVCSRGRAGGARPSGPRRAGKAEAGGGASARNQAAPEGGEQVAAWPLPGSTGTRGCAARSPASPDPGPASGRPPRKRPGTGDLGGACRRLVSPLPPPSLPAQPAGPDVTPSKVLPLRATGARDSWPRGRGWCRHEPAWLGQSVRVSGRRGRSWQWGPRGPRRRQRWRKRSR